MLQDHSSRCAARDKYDTRARARVRLRPHLATPVTPSENAQAGRRPHPSHPRAISPGRRLRMFEKVDLNGDMLIDLNEFLWMQTPSTASRGKGATPSE